MQVEVVPRPDRYEIQADGEVVGYVAIRRPDEGPVVFVHTEIDPAYEGEGLGGRLARGALDHVRERGERVIAQCPFIAGYIRRHPEYADLLAGRD